MRHLGGLWQAVKLLSSARNLAIETRRFDWRVTPPSTFYLDAEYADIRLVTEEGGLISAKVEVPLGIGWQLATDQDEAGVYIVAKRKPVIGSISRAKFTVALPSALHISLKLAHCQLRLDDFSARLELPPSA